MSHKHCRFNFTNGGETSVAAVATLTLPAAPKFDHIVVAE